MNSTLNLWCQQNSYLMQISSNEWFCVALLHEEPLLSGSFCWSPSCRYFSAGEDMRPLADQVKSWGNVLNLTWFFMDGILVMEGPDPAHFFSLYFLQFLTLPENLFVMTFEFILQWFAAIILKLESCGWLGGWQAGISVSQRLADLHVLCPESKSNPLQPGIHRHHKASNRFFWDWWIAGCLGSPELRPCSTTISTAFTRAAALWSSTKLASQDMEQVEVVITSQYIVSLQYFSQALFLSLRTFLVGSGKNLRNHRFVALTLEAQIRFQTPEVQYWLIAQSTQPLESIFPDVLDAQFWWQNL